MFYLYDILLSKEKESTMNTFKQCIQLWIHSNNTYNDVGEDKPSKDIEGWKLKKRKHGGTNNNTEKKVTQHQGNLPLCWICWEEWDGEQMFTVFIN